MSDAGVNIRENDTPTDELGRLRSAVSQRQRQLDEVTDAPDRVEAKYRKLTAGREPELKEAKRIVAEARKNLKDAKAALDAAEKAEG